MHQQSRLGWVAIFLATLPESANGALAADAYTPFDGEKTAWHDGFARYDFVLDEQTLAITPFKVSAGEGFGVSSPASGQRRCIVVVPKRAAPGNPWSWRGCYWDHQPQTEVELLRRGFHIAYISADTALKPGKKWDAWYAYLTEKHGLSKKPAFIGMSRGGEYAYTWATTHPDRVSCIYADNPGGNREVLSRLEELARNDVPLLHVCGSIDPILGKYSTAIENIYQQFGGRISVLVKEGIGHHPHSLRDPKLLADFIEQSVAEATAPPAPPTFVGRNFAKGYYYSSESSFRHFPAEGNYVTCRGPLFAECYERFDAWIGFAAPTTIIVPKKEAPGRPWVFRAGLVARDAVVDQALLAKGFHIVVGPVGYDDGPHAAEWSKLYKFLSDRGFSRRPVLEGAGGAAGTAYAWAIENPDKVSCIYAENPILHSPMRKASPLNDLAPLARAGVPLMHVCGSLDPLLNDQTRVAEKRYKDLGGKITVIVKEGEEHYPRAPKDPKPVVDFITENGMYGAHYTEKMKKPGGR
jgi:hypothetical protein